jgi:hypothetical protein
MLMVLHEDLKTLKKITISSMTRPWQAQKNKLEKIMWKENRNGWSNTRF